MEETAYLRKQIVKHLKGGEAFMPIDQILDEMPYERAGEVPAELPYSFWQQLYHLRYAQKDILDFSTNPDYKAPSWPGDYWPDSKAPASRQEWEETIAAYQDEREQFVQLVSDEQNGLFRTFDHGSGQTLLREALLVIEHSAYHTGQMLVIMRLLGLHD
ncbi:DinB family protein [Roseivirga sp. BDSF3-8]|uniref:DinB family protein n=1 Tax=Roseivirga sp. BDSF3-8 TaxID=3241598 RepID=UPI00353276C0